MKLVALGLNHKTAPVDVREAFAVDADQARVCFAQLGADPALDECFVISTCNRVEIYAVPSGDPTAARRALQAAFVSGRGLDPGFLETSGYWLVGREAASHLFRVTASLDSMVVGEPQILGQVKEAVELARECGALGSVLERVVQRAFSAAKTVRSQTGIARTRVSVGSVAVDLARSIFAKLEDCKVLLVGAGEMGQVTARSLASAGVARVYVTNRSYERAQALSAEHGWRARAFHELPDLLGEVDVVLTSTGAPRPIIDRQTVKKAIKARKYRPLFIVDIAVPRDVSADVGDLDTVYLYNVDDLRQITNTNMQARRREAHAAEDLVEAELEELARWFRGLEIQPTIAAIRRRADQVAKAEFARTLNKRLNHLSVDDRAAIEKMLSATISKLLHPTMVTLRERAGGPEGTELLELAGALHGVDADFAVAQELPDSPSESPEDSVNAEDQPRSVAS